VKNFDKDFDSYELSDERLMTIELHPQGLARYRELANNPIYYYHAIQYTNGELYRAIFGYENFWDKKLEDNFMLSLDFFLSRLTEKRDYYFEDLEVFRSFRLEGIPWPSGVKPKHLNFAQRHAAYIPRGMRVLARVNLIDKPNHVDLDFEDGRVFSVSFMIYLRWKERQHLRKIKSENPTRRQTQSEPDRTSQTKSQRREVSSAHYTSRENTSQKTTPQLHHLREAFRRQATLRKARQKI